MAIKINAATRLRAGWFDKLSDVAKKAYLKLHPNSRAGKGGTNPKGGDRKAAEEEHKKHREAYDKHRDAMHDDSTDAEWVAHDAALKRLEKSRDRLKRMK